MSRRKQTGCSGFTLLEVAVVVVVLAALAATAMAQYAASRKKAEATACLSNRRNIEMEETAYYVQNGVASLKMSQIYACPSGGVYVWLVSNPQDERYPRAGCSVHYAGEEIPSSAPITTTTSAQPTTTSSVTPTTSVMSTTTTTTALATTTSQPPATTTPTSTTMPSTTSHPGKGWAKGHN